MFGMIAAIFGRTAAAAAGLVFASTASSADPAQLAQSVADFKAAAREVVALLESVQDPTTAASAAPKIVAATDRKAQAEMAVQAAMQGMDPNDKALGMQIQQAFQEIQQANQAVAAAEMQATERQAASGAKQ